jgi:hypothetical protein
MIIKDVHTLPVVVVICAQPVFSLCFISTSEQTDILTKQLLRGIEAPPKATMLRKQWVVHQSSKLARDLLEADLFAFGLCIADTTILGRACVLKGNSIK